jgi:hypothetical protein
MGLVMPAWFNSAAHESIHNQLVLQKPKHEAEWMSFGIAWKAVAYRAKAAFTYHEQFTASIRKSKAPLPEERYTQEHALFAFFSSVLSSIECYFYANYCIGAIASPSAFPASTPKDLRVYPANVAALFAATFPGDALATHMQSVILHGTFAELSDIRNVLSHRGAPPRHHYQGGVNHGKAMMPSNPKAPAAQWTYTFELTDKTTEDRWVWATTSLAALLSATDTFCRGRLVV